MSNPRPHQSIYDKFAGNYDAWDSEHRDVSRHRRQLVHRLTGRILEIGVGTGLSFEHYRAGADVTGVDVCEAMLCQARARANHRPKDATKLLNADAEDLPFLDGTFHVAVGMFVFCSLEHPEGAATELSRVVRFGGRFLTMGYHSGMVAEILQSTGWKIRSQREWQDPTDDRLIGKIVAINLAAEAVRHPRIDRSP